MSEFDADVVIVGAGPTGLMAASLLLRAGVKIRLLEKSPTQAKESRALGIHARSLEYFHFMGIADKFLEQGLIVHGAQIFVEGHNVATIDFSDIGRNDTPFPFILMLPQCDTEVILAADVKEHGGQIEYNVEVMGFEQSPEGVTVTARKPDASVMTIRAKYIIGADGAHSIVRRALGLTFDGAAYDQSFLLADAKLDWDLDDDHFKIFLSNKEFALYFPMHAKGRARVIATQAEKPKKATSGEGVEQQGSIPATLEEVQEGFRSATRTSVSLNDPAWLSRYRVHHRGVNKYSKGRAFVAGDAAHIHSPVGAQGMNTGLQDVANLCWKLAMVIKGAASHALLDTYHTERWPVGQKLLNFTDRAFSAIASKQAWVTSLRNMLVPVVANIISHSAFIRRRAFNFVSQLGIHYSGHSFLEDDMLAVAPGHWREYPLPGMRAPNAAIAHGLDVFSLIEGYRFHVLALSLDAMNDAAVNALETELAALPQAVGLPLERHIIAYSLMGRDPRIIQAETRDVFNAYRLNRDVTQALYLVRPDGHIAFRCDRFDVQALQRFIKEKLTGIG